MLRINKTVIRHFRSLEILEKKIGGGKILPEVQVKSANETGANMHYVVMTGEAECLPLKLA
jgi:hypothetical protein